MVIGRPATPLITMRYLREVVVKLLVGNIIDIFGLETDLVEVITVMSMVMLTHATIVQ